MGGVMAHPHRLASWRSSFSLAALGCAAALAVLLAAPAPARAVDGTASGNDAPAARALGAACAADDDCDSGLCRPFRGHTVQLCTRPCTVETQLDDCPQPLTSGYCS